MIELKNIDFFYKEKEFLLKDYTLCLNDKIKYWLKGKNGTGKTTLLKILLGILKVKNGTCVLNYNKKKTLFIPSTPFYEPYMSLEDFLTFYLNKMLNMNLDYKSINEVIVKLELESNRHTLCKDLSKGTIQKIIISPLFTDFQWDYLFMDEPFEHLDMDTCKLLKSKIISLNSFVLIINHKEHLLENTIDFERIHL
ncbi:ATP-binding cassette domain-containing protein [Peribacillus frigoritolerans]|uniref:ATP-binding cassette domain-containing protein n=1 Tax=Peribacillus castrilensis TaxID=2897690 RepID=A0AAW9N8J9_9BACI|nr:ATP-binding cassette domain-containing protein [Peribacillus castrilensis]MEC0347035.1 ATP-binding cassette domain-containing protein [Peribacillus castrilensis]